MEVSLMQLSRDQFLIYLEESVMALTNNSRWNFLPESLMGVLLGEFLKKKKLQYDTPGGILDGTPSGITDRSAGEKTDENLDRNPEGTPRGILLPQKTLKETLKNNLQEYYLNKIR